MKRKYTSLIICVCFAVAGTWYLSFLKNGTIKVSSSEMERAEYNYDNTNLTAEIHTSTTEGKVYISGEVNNPGLYEIEKGIRISDVIEMAGGTTDSADLNGLNLSQYVFDEENIIIPATGCEGLLININTADKQTLMSLDGIGDKLSAAIIDYRNKNGNFKSTHEIKNVSRIGESTYKKIKDKITV